METHLVQKNNELLQTLLGKLTQVESNMDNLKSIIQEKINPSKKEFLDDDDLENMFGITKNMRYKMTQDGILKKYKLRGKASKSLYKYSEVIESIERGLIYPRNTKSSNKHQ